MTTFLNLIAIACGGAAGAVGRYLISLPFARAGAPDYVATFITNVIGCFCIGFAFRYFEARSMAEWVRPLVITGTLGAFTTFSTFSLQSMHLLEDRQYFHLSANVLLSVILGFIAVQAGLLVAGQYIQPSG